MPLDLRKSFVQQARQRSSTDRTGAPPAATAVTTAATAQDTSSEENSGWTVLGLWARSRRFINERTAKHETNVVLRNGQPQYHHQQHFVSWAPAANDLKPASAPPPPPPTSPIADVHTNLLAVPPVVPAVTSSPTLMRQGYELGETLGSGSYSKVKVAYSHGHKRKVAIKIVTKMAASEKYLKKFLPREMEIINLVRHRNVIPFLQCIESSKRFYVVMELAVNGDLLTTIEKRLFIDELQAWIWFHQLLDGIEHIHNIGVVHRDLKCENILLDDAFSIRISDFGFARFALGRNFLCDTYCGSYAYAAPEILKGVPYGPQFSDIWSLGVVLYAMVFGRLPFDDSNLRVLLQLVQSKVMFPLAPNVSNDCKDVMRRIFVSAIDRPSIEEIRSLAWFGRQPAGDRCTGTAQSIRTRPAGP